MKKEKSMYVAPGIKTVPVNIQGLVCQSFKWTSVSNPWSGSEDEEEW